ncbi:MAG: ACT domain-containing protein [Candidatus Margulisiibacteriota bacterium]
MLICQISVFLENRKGRLYEVSSVLGKACVNIKALTIAESSDFGILRMVTDRPDAAANALKEAGFTAETTEIVAVEVEDEPGGLAKVLKVIDDNDLNLEYMYGFVEKHTDKALMVFRFEDPQQAVKILIKNRINTVKAKDISAL